MAFRSSASPRRTPQPDGPDYDINPRYRDAIAAVFAVLDSDKDGYLTRTNLAAEAGSKSGQSAMFRSEPLLREIYQLTGTQYRDSDLAINLDAYLNLLAITAQVEPESAWGDLRRMRGRNVLGAEVLQKLKRTDMPSGELRTPRAQLVRTNLDRLNNTLIAAAAQSKRSHGLIRGGLAMVVDILFLTQHKADGSSPKCTVS
ncbi:hypothetical protein GGF31_003297 [Allomyces arbusculus]|nr:hypothetical protein GGF31_003297 [Allomyces arbusculus]